MIVTAWKASELKRMLKQYKANRRKDGDNLARRVTFEEWVEVVNPPKRKEG